MKYTIFNRGNGQQFVHGGENDASRMLKGENLGDVTIEMVLAAMPKMNVGEIMYVGPNWVITRTIGPRASVDVREAISRPRAYDSQR